LDFRGKKLCEGRKNKTLFKGIYSFFVIVVIEFLKRLVVCLLLVFFRTLFITFTPYHRKSEAAQSFWSVHLLDFPSCFV